MWLINTRVVQKSQEFRVHDVYFSDIHGAQRVGFVPKTERGTGWPESAFAKCQSQAPPPYGYGPNFSCEHPSSPTHQQLGRNRGP